MSKIHPSTWRIREAKPSGNQTKSNSLVLPMGPSHIDMSISTVALKKIVCFSREDITYKYQLLKLNSGAIAQCYCRLLESHSNIYDVKGISKDVALTMEIWYKNYTNCIDDFNMDKPHTMKQESAVDIKDVMTRNAFAGQALNSLIIKYNTPFANKDEIAKEAFAYADAMMKHI